LLFSLLVLFQISCSLSIPEDQLQNLGGACTCAGTKCSCCAEIKFTLKTPFGNKKFDQTGCLVFLYNGTELEIAVQFTLDGKVVLQESLSARNPDFCFGIQWGIELCVDFQNLQVDHHHFSGCSSVAAKWEGITLVNVPLGCFSLNV